MLKLLGGRPADDEFMPGGPTARAPGMVGNNGGPRWLGCGGGNNCIDPGFIFGGRCNPKQAKKKIHNFDSAHF